MTDQTWPERELPSGVYRHYKGPLYLVLGYAHDANADTLADVKGGYVHDDLGMPTADALGKRTVVVYIGLELDKAKSGPRLTVRTADDFFAMVHLADGSVCDRFGSSAVSPSYPQGERVYYCQCPNQRALADQGITPRFKYEGATHEPSLLTQPGGQVRLPDGCVDGHSPSREGCSLGVDWP